MNFRIRTIRMALVLAVTVFPIAGCWSVNEINDLAIITVLGIDQTDDGAYRISASVIRPNDSANLSLSSGSSQERSSVVATSTGDTMFAAMRKLSSLMAKRIYWAHLQAVIVGKQAADEHLITALDILARQHEFRKNISVLVTRGTAEEIIRSKPSMEGSLGAELDGIIKYSKFTGMTTVNDISHFISSISSNTEDHFTGEISTNPQQGVSMTQDGSDRSALSLRGTAVFKKGKLVGWMNGEETRGVMWLIGKVKSGIVELKCPADQSGTISVEIMHAVRTLKPGFDEDKPFINASIAVDAQIGEISCPQFQLDSASVDQLNEDMKEQIDSNIKAALAKAQMKWETDIFQFGRSIYRKYPKMWKKLAPGWREGGLKQLKVNVRIESNIWRSGLLDDPTQVDKEA